MGLWGQRGIEPFAGAGEAVLPKTRRWDVALTGVAQWVGCYPAKREVAGLIPAHGTGLDCEFGHAFEGQVIDVSLTSMFLSPFSLPSPLSKHK